MKRGTVTEVVTESEDEIEEEIEIMTEKSLLIWKVQEHPEDTETGLGVETGNGNGNENETDTDITETDTANPLVTFALNIKSCVSVCVFTEYPRCCGKLQHLISITLFLPRRLECFKGKTVKMRLYLFSKLDLGEMEGPKLKMDGQDSKCTFSSCLYILRLSTTSIKCMFVAETQELACVEMLLKLFM